MTGEDRLRGAVWTDDGPDGGAIVAALEAARRGGAARRELLRDAVRLIRDSSARFDWVGVYELEGEVLRLAEYVGEPTEHVRIPVGTGVCGTAVAEERDLNIEDVSLLENYLACSVSTRSEAVVLIRDPEAGTIHGQLDLDSDRVRGFGERDMVELRRVADWLARLYS